MMCAALLWRAGLASLLLALGIGLGLTLGQSRRLDSLAQGARLWDAQHHEILRMTAAGDPPVYSREFDGAFPPYGNAEAEPRLRAPLLWRMRLFYGLEYKPTF